MKERPILFSTPMVQAILKGKKTQTRRLVNEGSDSYVTDSGSLKLVGPYGSIGDKLWVRETFCPKLLSDEPPGQYYHYRADDNFVEVKWKPSIFMPRVACRITLKITDLRIKRLHDMNDQDALAEGIEMVDDFNWKDYRGKYSGFDFDAKIDSEYGKNLSGEVTSYASLWSKLNGLELWLANPFVWVISFVKEGGSQC
jgi:hypothetical protein